MANSSVSHKGLIRTFWNSPYALFYIIGFAFVTRFLLSIAQALFITLPDSTGDAVVFENTGWQAAQAWHGIGILPHVANSYRYSGLIGQIYYLFGHHPFLIQSLNVLLGVVTVYIIYKITYELSSSPKAAKIAALIAAIFPAMNLYSAIILRENFIIFFLSLSVFFFLRWYRTGYRKYGVIAILAVTCAALFHWGMLAVMCVFVPFLVWYRPKEKRWKLLPNSFMLAYLAIILLGILSIMVFSDHLFSLSLHRGIMSSHVVPVEKLVKHLDEYSDHGDAVYLAEFRPRGFLDILWQTPIRIVYFLFMPFPWKVHSMGDIAGFIDALLYVFLCIGAAVGIKVVWKKEKAMAITLLCIFAVFITMFAWGVTNYGAGIRHRNKISFLLIAIAAIGYDEYWKRRKNNEEIG